MIKLTLGDTECNHRYFPVPCVALDETAAEKWAALSRRVVDANQTSRDSDKHLVRHLYDLYQLHHQNRLSGNYYVVRERVLEKEHAMFGAGAFEDMHAKIAASLEHLRADKKWKEHWQFFLEQMVYQKEKPSFEQAVVVVEELNSR